MGVQGDAGPVRPVAAPGGQGTAAGAHARGRGSGDGAVAGGRWPATEVISEDEMMDLLQVTLSPCAWASRCLHVRVVLADACMWARHTHAHTHTHTHTHIRRS